VNCIVTAGPTYEPLDEVRRLTNFSTGSLGSKLATHLSAKGHRVVLLRGYYSVYHGPTRADQVSTFTTTADLRERLQALAGSNVQAVYHAAAVSDFGFGAVFKRTPSGELMGVRAGKLPTREHGLLVELAPTPKIIAELRTWYPAARLVGWKFEVDGTRQDAISAATNQIARCKTDASVVNGPAYGDGFGIVRKSLDCLHAADRTELFRILEQIGSES